MSPAYVWFEAANAPVLLHPSPPLPAPSHNLPCGAFTLTAALSPAVAPAREAAADGDKGPVYFPPSKHFSAQRQPTNQDRGDESGQIERHRGHCLPADRRGLNRKQQRPADVSGRWSCPLSPSVAFKAAFFLKAPASSQVQRSFSTVRGPKFSSVTSKSRNSISHIVAWQKQKDSTSCLIQTRSF